MTAVPPETPSETRPYRALFGATVLGEAGPGSDVDLLVEFSAPVSLFHFMEVREHLEAILGCRVDLVTRAALKPQLREAILEEAVDVTWGTPAHVARTKGNLR